jgi:hypothetical protein
MRSMKALTFILLCSIATIAQSNRGGISGSVFDANGAGVPGATVTITNLGTNQSVTVRTSDTGSYSATELEPVAYSITVELTGFKEAFLSKVKVDTATTVTMNVTLEIGDVSEKVIVKSEVPLINTESGTTGQTITERQLQDVPLFNRSVLDLAISVPNVTGDVGSENPSVTSGAPVPGFNLSLNGGRPGSTTLLADGANNTGVGIARAVVSFSPETVQEFTVQTSAYSAEFGQTGGGVINVTTKSGTNRLTGTALWYTRNPATNAQLWTNGSSRPPNNLRENQLSFTVGGPVYLPRFGEGGKAFYNGHDRTFFFFAAEPRWRQDFLVVDTLLPTPAERAGDFSGLVRTGSGFLPAAIAAQFNQTVLSPATIYKQFNLIGNQLKPIILPANQTFQPFAGNIIPQSMIDPTAVKLLQFMPAGGGYYLTGGGLVANYQVNRFVQQNETRYTTRIDHAISNKNHLNLRFTVVPAVGIKGFGSDVNGNGATYSNSKQFVISDTHTFTANVINELRLDYIRGTFSDDYSPEFSIKGGRNLATEFGIPSLTSGGMPLFQISSDANAYNAFANIGSAGSTNNYNVEERYDASDTISWIRGNHSLKFGGNVDHALLNVIPFFGASGGRWDFRVIQTSNNQKTNTANGGDPFASFLLGVPNVDLIRPVLIPYYYRWNSGAVFVQDGWKVRPNLTLNIGLRYSLQLPRTEKNNLQGVFLPDQAQSFNLATPLTLPGGQVINSVLVPPFAYAGRDGRSKYITPIDYKDFEPRFGFAWSPKKILGWKFDNDQFVIRGGYGISHVPLTGNNRLPNPDFGATTTASTLAGGSTGAPDTTSALRLSSNIPQYSSLSPTAALNIPANGLVYLNSLAIPGYVVSNNVKVPYAQNWNLSLSYEIFKNSVLEVAYVGSKGTHLFLPLINLNPRDFNTIQAIEASGNATTNSDTGINDPLGRRDLLGNLISVPVGSYASQFAGFNHLYEYYNSAGNSIRHGMYVSFQHRVSRGLTLTAAYTFGKSIDDASDASPDKNVLSSGVSQGGSVTYGAPRSLDRSLSAFDIRNSFTTVAIYDLPFGRGRKFFGSMWKPLDNVVGGWTIAGIGRLRDGYPFWPAIPDTNRLSGDLTHTIRPDVVPGVPILNPNYDPNCKASNLCEPYVNPAAFERPIIGQLGNAARTLDIRGPMQKYFDVSFQKNFPFPIGKSENRRIQLRVDLLNAFNHPNFAVSSGNLGATDFMGLPTEFTTEGGVLQPITTAEYNTWATANGQPPASTPAGAKQLAQIRGMVNSQRLPSGALPLDFFHMQLPQTFFGTKFTGYDITTLQGFKLYRLRQAYGTNNGFGQLRELGMPRYVQFGIKIYF